MLIENKNNIDRVRKLIVETRELFGDYPDLVRIIDTAKYDFTDETELTCVNLETKTIYLNPKNLNIIGPLELLHSIFSLHIVELKAQMKKYDIKEVI